MLSTKAKKKSVGKMSSIRLLAILLVSAVALILGTAAPQVWAKGGKFIEYEDAECGFEANLTDWDTGFWAAVDAEAWKWLLIYRIGEDYKDKQLLFSTSARGNLGRLGVTELRFESNEPEESFEEILQMFPEGECKFVGMTTDFKYLRSKAELSHDFACGAQEVVFTSGEEEINPEEDCVPADKDLVVSWGAVETKLTAVNGEEDFECNEPLEEDEEIDGYEVYVEAANQELFYDIEADDEPEVVVPASFLEGIEIGEEDPKVEILVVFGSNRSIREIEFTTCAK
jgi:hypothetical protein